MFSAEAEQQRAFELALENTLIATDLLRALGPANVNPFVSSFTAPVGMSDVPRPIHFVVRDGFPQFSEVPIIGYDFHWIIQREELQLMEPLLSRLSAILLSPSPSEFEEQLITALRLHSRAVQAPQLEDKLVYIFFGLEMLLVRKGESIEQTAADRMAFLMRRDAEGRKEAVRLFRHAYNLRSRIVHQGESPSGNRDDLVDFARLVWEFYMLIIPGSHRVPSKDAFLKAIDDEKYS